MIEKIFAIFIGGGFGAVLRFLVTFLSKKYFMAPIFGTFFVNIIGCFLIGLVFGYLTYKFQNISETVKLFITVGFLGGLTTFSTFNLEIFELIKAGKVCLSLAYMVSSCALGLLFTFFGYLVSNQEFFTAG